MSEIPLYTREVKSDGELYEWNGFEWMHVDLPPHVDRHEHTTKAVDKRARARLLAASDALQLHEHKQNKVAPLCDLFKTFLETIGESQRPGLAETPMRAARAWLEWTSGYEQDAASILKVFEDGAEQYDSMVLVHDIPFYSHCEHHLAPIFGHATVGYIPQGKIVGLSKLNRLVDMFARRLQVQERLTSDIANALMDNLKPLGVGVLVRARHFCMESRGIKHAGCHTTTSALLGVFRDDAAVRAEFLKLAENTRAQ